MAIKTVEDLYRGGLGRAPDAAGAAYWSQKFGPTIEPNEIETFMAAAAPELQQRQQQAYADGARYQAQAAADRANNSTPLARAQNRAEEARTGSSAGSGSPPPQPVPQYQPQQNYDQRFNDTIARYENVIRGYEERLNTAESRAQGPSPAPENYRNQYEDYRSRYEALANEREAERQYRADDQLSSLRSGRTASGGWEGLFGGGSSDSFSLASGRQAGRHYDGDTSDQYRRGVDPTDSVLNRGSDVVAPISGSYAAGRSRGQARERTLARGGSTSSYYASRFG